MKKSVVFLAITLLIIAGFYAHTINYPWREWDESLIFRELIYPIPKNFREFIDYATKFGFMVYFEASNPFYSKIGNLRCDPLNAAIVMFVEMLGQKRAWFYHCVSLGLHLINSSILFFCLVRISKSFTVVCLLVLLWALHPLQIESVLFSCNWSAILAYSFAFTTFYLGTKK